MRKYIPVIFGLLLLLAQPYRTVAQDEELDLSNTANLSCAENLQLATSLYDEGKIHEIPGIFGVDRNGNIRVNSCLKSENLTKEEKAQAYRLLTLVYLQLDEPRLAEDMILSMLNTNKEYQINPAIDPTEFINLYNNYRTKPVIKLGGGGGTNVTYINAVDRNGQFDAPRYMVETLGTQFGIIAEFDFSDIVLNTSLKDRFLLTSEFFISNKKLTYTYDEELQNVENHTTMYTYSSLDVRIMGNYNLIPVDENSNSIRKFQAHATLGVTGEYLFNVRGQLTDADLVAEGGEQQESTPRDLNYMYNDFVGTVFGGTSIRYKLGLPWLFMNLRYNFSFTDPFIAENKYQNMEPQFTFASFVPNGGRFSYYTATIGVIVPIYNFKKIVD